MLPYATQFIDLAYSLEIKGDLYGYCPGRQHVVQVDGEDNLL